MERQNQTYPDMTNHSFNESEIKALTGSGVVLVRNHKSRSTKNQCDIIKIQDHRLLGQNQTKMSPSQQKRSIPRIRDLLFLLDECIRL